MTLRLFSLLFFSVNRQEPETLNAQLEYYEGMAFRGSLPLSKDTAVLPHKPGKFSVVSHSLSREVVISTEKDKLAEGMAWIVTLQQAINSIGGVKAGVGSGSGGGRKSRPVSVLSTTSSAPPSRPSSMLDTSIAVVEGSARHRLQLARNNGGEEPELDGEEIDNARWAAIRKGEGC